MQLTLRALRVTAKTVWLFVEVVDSVNATGIGEATSPGEESAVIAALEALIPTVLDRSADPALRPVREEIAFPVSVTVHERPDVIQRERRTLDLHPLTD
ncbi:MAG TPA: hypothetical protein VGW79_01920 [Actinomycetota bacterium]|nr:hypothetical protein [Actinomycetota bacterium]